jgi:hypothetical protein
LKQVVQLLVLYIGLDAYNIYQHLKQSWSKADFENTTKSLILLILLC